MEKSAEIIELTGAHLPTGDTPQSVISLLNTLNIKAERGELIGLAVAYVEPQNHVFTHICNGSATWNMIVSAVGALFYDVHRKWAGTGK